MTTQKLSLCEIRVILPDATHASDTGTLEAVGGERWITLALFVGMLASGLSGEWLAHRRPHVEAIRPNDKQAALQSRPVPHRTLGHMASQIPGLIRTSRF